MSTNKEDDKGDNKEEDSRNIKKETDDNKEGTNDDGNEDESNLPIDRGWAWMVVLGCFINNFMYTSNMFIQSVLFLDIMLYFDAEATIVTMLQSVNSIFYCLATQLFVNLLMPVVSVRQMATVGGICYSLVTLLFVIFPYLFVFFLMNIVKSTARGAAFVPSQTLIGHYFKRRRALAISLSLLGNSMSSIAVPPLARFLRDEFGFRGAYLIISGFEMNTIVASLLLRPLSNYKTAKAKTDLKLSRIDSGKNQETAGHNEAHQKKNYSKETEVLEHETDEAQPMLIEEDSSIEQLPRTALTAVTQTIGSSSGNDTVRESTLFSASREMDSKIENERFHNNKYTTVETLSLENLSGPFFTSPEYKVDNSGRTLQENEAHVPENQGIEPLEMESPSAESDTITLPMSEEYSKDVSDRKFYSDYKQSENENSESERDVCNYIESLTQSSSSAPAPLKTDVESPVSSLPDQPHPNNPILSQRLRKLLNSVIDFSLLKNYLAVFYLVSSICTFVTLHGLTYIPSHAVKMGVTQSQGALLLTIVGVSDVVTRVGFGYFTDLGLVRPGRIVACIAFGMGLLCQFSSLYTSFGALIFMAVIYGGIGFLPLSLNTPLIVDLLGVQNLGKMLALWAVVTALSSFIQYPIHGVLIHSTGSFVASYHYIGAFFMLGALILLAEPLVRRWQNLRERRQQEKD